MPHRDLCGSLMKRSSSRWQLRTATERFGAEAIEVARARVLERPQRRTPDRLPNVVGAVPADGMPRISTAPHLLYYPGPTRRPTSRGIMVPTGAVPQPARDERSRTKPFQSSAALPPVGSPVLCKCHRWVHLCHASVGSRRSPGMPTRSHPVPRLVPVQPSTSPSLPASLASDLRRLAPGRRHPGDASSTDGAVLARLQNGLRLTSIDFT